MILSLENNQDKRKHSMKTATLDSLFPKTTIHLLSGPLITSSLADKVFKGSSVVEVFNRDMY